MGRKKKTPVSRSGSGDQIPEDLTTILAWCRQVIQAIWALTWPDAGSALVKVRDSLIDLLVAAPEVDDTLQRELIVASDRFAMRRFAEVYGVEARHSLDVVRELGWRALDLAHAECTKALQFQMAMLRETRSTPAAKRQSETWNKAIAAIETAGGGQARVYQERVVQDAFRDYPAPARDSTPNAAPPAVPRPGGDLDLEVEKTVYRVWDIRKDSATGAKPMSERTVPKDVELKGKAAKLTELLMREEQHRLGQSLDAMLVSLGIPKDTFYQSRHFQSARYDWERLKEARENDRQQFRSPEADDHSY